MSACWKKTRNVDGWAPRCSWYLPTIMIHFRCSRTEIDPHVFWTNLSTQKTNNILQSDLRKHNNYRTRTQPQVRLVILSHICERSAPSAGPCGPPAWPPRHFLDFHVARVARTHVLRTRRVARPTRNGWRHPFGALAFGPDRVLAHARVWPLGTGQKLARTKNNTLLAGPE